MDQQLLDRLMGTFHVIPDRPAFVLRDHAGMILKTNSGKTLWNSIGAAKAALSHHFYYFRLDDRTIGVQQRYVTTAERKALIKELLDIGAIRIERLQ